MSVIQSIRITPLTYPEPHDHNRMRHIAVARVELTDGTVGWGEAITMWPECSLAVKTIGENGLAPLLIGESPVDAERLWDKMVGHVWWYGREGVAAMAISALDTAIWDLKGKMLGQPLCRLFGAMKRDAIPVMACIHLNMDDIDWCLREFATFREWGYRIVKGGWGVRPGPVLGERRDLDMRLADGIRDIMGVDGDFVLDILAARTRWDLPTAIRRIREFEPLRPLWIEEPLPPWDYESHAALRAAVAVPIGTGEQEWTPEGYRRLIEARAADVIQVDPGRCLGVTGCLKAVTMAELNHLKFSTHTWSSAVNTAVGVHLLAAFPCGAAMDFKPHQSPMQHELVEDPWEQNEGMLNVRATAGLGITVREEIVRKYTLS
jgi:L-alanine-DL-glutamate epimerase-like enolase superfamily enzyme